VRLISHAVPSVEHSENREGFMCRMSECAAGVAVRARTEPWRSQIGPFLRPAPLCRRFYGFRVSIFGPTRQQKPFRAVLYGFGVAVPALDLTAGKGTLFSLGRSIMACGDYAPFRCDYGVGIACPLCRRHGRQSRATEDWPGRRGHGGWSAFLLADRNRGVFLKGGPTRAPRDAARRQRVTN
jgi:hypothetical protein